MAAAWLTYTGLTRQEFTNPTSIQWRRQPAIIVLHSTEGNSYPSATTYRDGRSAPHFTTDVRGRTTRQHYPLTEGAWALQAPGAVPTNSGGAIQIEIIGTCAATPRIQSVLDFTDDDLTYLAGLLRAIHHATGIPLTTSVPWIPYPWSYANGGGQRLNPAQWATYRGVLGHQHVPGNTHGDPGNIRINRLLELAQPTTTPGDDDMPLNADDLTKIAAIIRKELPPAIMEWRRKDAQGNPFGEDVAGAIFSTRNDTQGTAAAVTELQAGATPRSDPTPE